MKQLNVGQLKNEKITELNNLRVEYQHLLEKKQNLETEMKLSQDKLTIILQEYQSKSGELKNINNNIGLGIEQKESAWDQVYSARAELKGLRENIDDQIDKNKKKEEVTLAGIKKENKELTEKNKILADKTVELNKEVKEKEEKLKELVKEVLIKVKELEKINGEIGLNFKELDKRDSATAAKAANLNEWEKRLEFHNKRLQWIYKKLNMQFK